MPNPCMGGIMSSSNQTSSSNPTSSGRRRRPLTILGLSLCALVLVAGVWLWVTLQELAISYIAWKSAAMAGGGVICLVAVIAALRAGVENLFEWICDLVAAVVAAVGAIFRAILSLLGWD
jgi:hypothetical protein